VRDHTNGETILRAFAALAEGERLHRS
jgi:hypothetical protein